MLIIDNSYNQKSSLGSLTSTACQSLNTMHELNTHTQEYIAHKRKVTSELYRSSV